MQEFLTSIQSVYWLLSVVVVGLLINIISSYLRDGIDQIISKFSSYWYERTQTRKRSEYLYKILVSESKEEQSLLRMEIIHNRLRSIHYLILTILFALYYGYLKSNSDYNASLPFSINMISLYSATIMIGITSVNSLSYLLKSSRQSILLIEVVRNSYRENSKTKLTETVNTVEIKKEKPPSD